MKNPSARPAHRSGSWVVRTAVRFLVLFMVPVVIVATPGVGNAANFNDWHRVSVVIDAGPLPEAVLPSCDFPARYSEDGTEVTVGAGECRVVVGGSLGKAGNDFTVAFNGERAGADGSEPYVYSMSQDNPVVDASPTINPDLYGGSTGGNVYVRAKPGYSPTSGFTLSMWCSQPDGTGQVTARSGSHGVSLTTTPYNAGPWACPAGSGTVLSKVQVSSNQWWDKPAQIQTWTPDLVGPVAPGAGSGTPCSASYSGVLGPHPDDGFLTNAGTLPAGSAAFAGGDSYGACHVTEVCVTLQNDGWIADAEATGCMVSEWGAPWEKPAPDPEDTDEPAPTLPGGDTNPVDTPTDEPSFWGGVIDLLWKIVRGVGSVVSAIGSLPAKIVEAFSGLLSDLFVPSDDLFTGFVDDRKAAADGSSLGAWEDATVGGFGGLGGGTGTASAPEGEGSIGIMGTEPGPSGGSSTCDGPGFSFDGFGLAAGLDQTYHPLEACDGSSAKLASWSHLFATITICLFGFFRIMESITGSVGVLRQASIAQSFDWSNAHTVIKR